jgi:hypothetical protein
MHVEGYRPMHKKWMPGTIILVLADFRLQKEYAFAVSYQITYVGVEEYDITHSSLSSRLPVSLTADN